jgi:general secretion pathway protein H
VRWHVTATGFQFDGVPPASLPDQWLAQTTQASGNPVLQLGPEPIIGRQEVVLESSTLPGRSVRIATDGLRPFAVNSGEGP